MNRDDPRYTYIYNISADYSKPYIQRKFLAGPYNARRRFQEYLFVCPLKDLLTDSVIPLYVSKEYEVGWHKPGRFVFTNRFTSPQMNNNVEHSYDFVILAEEPARGFTEKEFDLEFHYLKIREYRQPGKTCKGMEGLV